MPLGLGRDICRRSGRRLRLLLLLVRPALAVLSDLQRRRVARLLLLLRVTVCRPLPVLLLLLLRWL